MSSSIASPTISIFTQAAILASDNDLVRSLIHFVGCGLPLLDDGSEPSDDNGLDVEAVGLVFCPRSGAAAAAMRYVMDDLRAKRGDQVFDTYWAWHHRRESVLDQRILSSNIEGPGRRLIRSLRSLKTSADRTSGD
mgnify:CR=1 FL=1